MRPGSASGCRAYAPFPAWLGGCMGGDVYLSQHGAPPPSSAPCLPAIDAHLQAQLRSAVPG